MMNQQEIEVQLWEYIDGVCTTGMQLHIEQMISTDEHWKNCYRKLLTIHHSIKHDLAPEQPPMRFTKNVLDIIAGTAITAPTRKYINPIIINVIASFFIISISGLIIYAITLTNWEQPPVNIRPLSFTENFDKVFSGKAFTFISCLNVITGLLLLDNLALRKKRRPLYNSGLKINND